MMAITIETKGLHPCTGLCLEALQALKEHFSVSNALDMGCGNGLLSLASAGLWNASVLAVDIAQQAVDDATANAQAHGLSHLVTARRSDFFSEAMIAARAPYDLIIFNLLAEPIMEHADTLRSLLAPGGLAVLGGILAWKADELERWYLSRGFTRVMSIAKTPWQLFAFQLSGGTHAAGQGDAIIL